MSSAGSPAASAVGRLPDPLIRIRAEARHFQAQGEARDGTAVEWARQVEAIRRAAPGVIVEDDGDTVRLGALSPGCVACKAGTWDCLFGSLSCNLDCAFCLKPRQPSGAIQLSALGRDLEEARARYAQAGVTGVSVSGGEPFLNPEQVLQWLSTLRADVPSLYLWAYTNGLPLSTSLLSRLAETGLNELRFNMAATGYVHPHVTRMLHEAARCIPAVTVEIPAIPEHEALLLGALQTWAAAGVKSLNLHELIYEPGSRSEDMEGARAACRMPDGHPCAFNPRSSELVARVFEKVAADRIPLAVNYCSLRNKARQARGRRRLLAPWVLERHEQLLADGTAESLCFFDAEQVEFAHPSVLTASAPKTRGPQAARVRRLLPLHPLGKGQWVDFEILAENSNGHPPCTGNRP